MVKHCALTKSILTVGSNPGRGMRFNLPITRVPWRHTDKKDTGFSIHRPHIWETSRCCAS